MYFSRGSYWPNMYPFVEFWSIIPMSQRKSVAFISKPIFLISKKNTKNCITSFKSVDYIYIHQIREFI